MSSGLPNDLPPPLPEDNPDDSSEGTRRFASEGLPPFPVRPQRTPTLAEIPEPGGRLLAPPPLTGGQAPSAEAVPYRPTQRPAVALLCILDDGTDEGQWVRVRTDHFVIGRAEGDVTIPHDHLISSRHAELCRTVSKGKTVWDLRDLDSTNGTYVRISTAAVDPGQQILFGGRHYRFEDPLHASASASDADEDVPMTRRAIGGPHGPLVPSLVQLTERGDGQRYLLGKSDNWIGRDPTQCQLVLADDLMVSPRHARLYRDASGRWMLTDARSRNGTWFRIHKVRLRRTSQFQIGEQRFILRIPT